MPYAVDYTIADDSGHEELESQPYYLMILSEAWVDKMFAITVFHTSSVIHKSSAKSLITVAFCKITQDFFRILYCTTIVCIHARS